MGSNWKIRQDNKPKLPLSEPTADDGGGGPFAVLVYFFYLLSITTLSLLIPLSFLLLARLSSANYLTAATTQTLTPPEINPSLIIHPVNILLQATVAAVTISTFIDCLNTRRIIITADSPDHHDNQTRPRLQVAWLILWVFHLCVGLGVRATMDAAGVDGSVGLSISNHHRSGIGGYLHVFRRVVFFVGVHEMTTHWYRMVVKQVARDTIYGGGSGGGRRWCESGGGSWVEKVALVGSCWWMCWLLLRDEVEVLAVVAEIKMKRMGGVGFEDVVGWWLYYLTVTIGMARFVQGVLWFGMVTVVGRVVESRDDGGDEEWVDGFYGLQSQDSGIVIGL